MRFEILTLFPEVFPSFLKTSILGRAEESGIISYGVHNIRDFAEGKHKVVDDSPYGGGAGMVMKIEPIAKALGTLGKNENRNEEIRTVVLSARGEQFTQTKAKEYAQLDQLVLICGRYEGIDQRVADHLADEEISIGPYVLAGGEIAALAVIEATARLIPGVLGNPESLVEESHTIGEELQTTSGSERSAAQIEYPQYTKPEEYQGWKVPEVLVSGDHAAIKSWRDEQRKKPE